MDQQGANMTNSIPSGLSCLPRLEHWPAALRLAVSGFKVQRAMRTWPPASRPSPAAFSFANPARVVFSRRKVLGGTKVRLAIRAGFSVDRVKAHASHLPSDQKVRAKPPQLSPAAAAAFVLDQKSKIIASIRDAQARGARQHAAKCYGARLRYAGHCNLYGSLVGQLAGWVARERFPCLFNGLCNPVSECVR
jgi:hypothetical protein